MKRKRAWLRLVSSLDNACHALRWDCVLLCDAHERAIWRATGPLP